MRQIIDVEEIQKIVLDILEYFDKVCKQNNLRYSLAFGTLIGAIRHKGFIPWDDDIDVAMPRPDYDKLHTILSKRKDRYKIIEYRSISKLIDTDTLLNETGYYAEKNIGVYLDIFPIDGMGNDREKGLKWAKRMWKNAKRNMYFEDLDKYGIKGKIIKILGQKNIRRYGKLMSKRYQFDRSKYCALAMDAVADELEFGATELYSAYIRHTFEKKEYSIFESYEYILKNKYGDYMKLPPEEERFSLHEYQAFWKNKKG